MTNHAKPSFRLAALLLVGALLAPVAGAGAVLADDLRDMAEGSTGLADNPATPGPDLYAPRVWGADIPSMPSLLVLDAPHEPSLLSAPRAQARSADDLRLVFVSLSAVFQVLGRGPPVRA